MTLDDPQMTPDAVIDDDDDDNGDDADDADDDDDDYSKFRNNNPPLTSPRGVKFVFPTGCPGGCTFGDCDWLTPGGGFSLLDGSPRGVPFTMEWDGVLRRCRCR